MIASMADPLPDFYLHAEKCGTMECSEWSFHASAPVHRRARGRSWTLHSRSFISHHVFIIIITSDNMLFAFGSDFAAGCEDRD